MGVLGEPKRTCAVALDATDGKILWKSEVGGTGDPNLRGGAVPRSTPATDGTFVFALCQGGELVCVQARTGKLVWKKAMDTDLGSEVPGYGWSESPLVDGNQVVVSPGSPKATVVALNKTDGATIWEAKAKGKVEYSSLAVAEVGGVRQYIAYNNAGIAGIAAASGALLWSASWRADTPGATPVCKDGIVLVSFHNGGSDAAFRIAGAGSRLQAEEVYKIQEFTNHHGGMVAVGNHVYGTSDAALICLELRTGKVVWRDRCVGKGSVIAADGHLIVRSEGGAVALVEATPAGFREKGRFAVKRGGGDAAWANPVISGGRLYLRDWDNLYCYDLREK
jgi:outer membrane protein assembly factor BamB